MAASEPHAPRPSTPREEAPPRILQDAPPPSSAAFLSPLPEAAGIKHHKVAIHKAAQRQKRLSIPLTEEAYRTAAAHRKQLPAAGEVARARQNASLPIPHHPSLP